MRTPTILGIGATVFVLAACQSPVAPGARTGRTVNAAVTTQQTGPSNECYGQIIAGIAATWPWAHDDQMAFAPPPGAIALWIQIFGPDVGISSVRQLQVLFCTSA